MRYSDLKSLTTFEERFNYLKLAGTVGADTFGFDRYMNQMLYRSAEWKQVRNKVILRDNGCDLGIEGREIASKPIIHHINPISVKDIAEGSDSLFDLENLITVSLETHNALHYGSLSKCEHAVKERKPNDTCPWKGV